MIKLVKNGRLEINQSFKIDESLELLDFKCNSTGFVYMSPSDRTNQSEVRKQVAKTYNVNFDIYVFFRWC